MDDLICEECGEPCEGSFVDFGIGPGEFWGQKFNDVKMQYVSTCCEATVLLDGQEYIPDDPRNDYDPAEDYE